MALVLADRVKETTSTTGTGTVTLLGAATGFQSFAVIGNANTTYYTIAAQSGSEWEVGIGTYTLSGTTLARTTILSNSAGTQPSALSFSAGTKDVFVTYPSGKSVNLDASGNVTALGTPVSATLTNATGLPISTGVSGLGSNVATFLATPSSANLAAALTDETGTGANVFATSPTLVTPALGTPSALVGTNITGTAAGLTAGNVTTNANLTGAVTSVGNATSLGSFTSAQLAGALTDETGTGANVFATSPTLVTPLLGTPTSGVMTNVTGLPLTTGVTGTLPVANGGTGITSFGTGVATWLGTPSAANLAAAVTDETGSGSLVFATSPSLTTPTIGGGGANFSGSTSGTTNFKAAAAAGATTITMPATTGTMALTSDLPTVNNGTLTMNVSGTGLSGSQTFTANQSSAATFTVTSNATNANTASTIVARDASGNFSAGTITAALSGNATNVTGTVAVANGGTGATTLTANNVVLGNGTSAVQFVAPGTSGNVLTSDGTTWTSAAGGFATGTVMLFVQTAAPTGWTKSTTHDNKALRVVSGSASSGGTTAFTTVFTNQTPTITTSGLSAGATTLSTSQIPSHSHTVSLDNNYTGQASENVARQGRDNIRSMSTGSEGGGGSHSHSISGSATSSAITLNVAYVDVIIATKN